MVSFICSPFCNIYFSYYLILFLYLQTKSGLAIVKSRSNLLQRILMRNFILLFLLVILTNGVSSQSRETSLALSNYRVERSEYAIVNGSKELWNTEATNNLLNAGLGYYIPVLMPNPNIGIGINASATVGILIYSTATHSISGDIALPVTASFRLGAGSTREATSPIGIGLGAGYRLNGLIVQGGDPFFIQEDPKVIVLCRPYLFAELVFDYQKRDKSFFDNFKIQFAFQPTYTKKTYDTGMREDKYAKMYYYSVSFIKFTTID